MRRFIVEQNVRHFRKVLEADADPETLRVAGELLIAAERELADLDAAADASWPGSDGPDRPLATRRRSAHAAS